MASPAPRSCPRCGNSITSSVVRCSQCGEAVGFSKSKLFLITVIVGVSVACAAFLIFLTQGSRTAKPNRCGSKLGAIEIYPVDGKSALEVPGRISIRYRDLGGQVEIAVSADGMPIIHANRLMDGKNVLDGSDVSFAAFPNGALCIQRTFATDGAQCGNAASAATAM